MSVSVMKKLTVFATVDDADSIVRKLMNLRCVEIRNSAEIEGRDTEAECLNRDHECNLKKNELEKNVAVIAQAQALLSQYSTAKKGLFGKSVKNANREEFCRDGSEKKAWDTVKEALSLEAKRDGLSAEISRLRSVCSSIEPWLRYELPLNYESTKYTDIILGVLPTSVDLDSIVNSEEFVGYAERVSDDATGQFISVICHKSDTDSVLHTLSMFGFIRSNFGNMRSTPACLFKDTSQEIMNAERESEAVREQLCDLARSLDDVEILYDIEATALAAAENKLKLVRTQKCVILDGWCPAESEDKVSSVLDKFECAYETEAPSSDDDVPILLKNNGYASSFEWVLGMYAYPKYGRFDPTFIMSIFYFIIFGIMFADVGYGLILVLGCIIGIKLLKPKKSMERTLRMFEYCGFSSMIMGALFGGWFGDLPVAIMTNMLGMSSNDPIVRFFAGGIWFNPLDTSNPDAIMNFLLLSLGVGAAHLVAGMAVKFYILCRDGKVIDAIFDIGSWWVLFAGIGLLFVNGNIGMWVAIAGVAMLVLTQGRAKKGIFGKLIGGIMSLYEVVNYISDLLSYSRILALGLAAGVISQVVNVLGTIMGGSIAGVIMLICVSVVGHLLNLAINVLGTFVHTSRLQYIEFLGKFYEDGGRKFEPALPSEKYSENE